MNINLRDKILNLDQEKIFSIYFEIPITEIRWSTKENWNRLHNPFREDDNPSLSFKWFSNKLIVRDWADNRYSGDIFKVVGYILNLNCFHSEQFVKLCERIYNDYYNFKSQANDEIVILSREKTIFSVTCKFRMLTSRDYDYFKSFGIEKKYVLKYVQAVSRYYINNNLTGYRNSYKDPCYHYSINSKFNKIYFPYCNKQSKYPRFVTDNTLQIDDITDIQYCKNIILIKSIKDKMLLIQFLETLNIDSESDIRIHTVSSETSSLNSNIVVILKRYCKHNIYSLFDSDASGLNGMLSLKTMYGIEPLIFSTDNSAKDPTDYYKKYGYQKTFNTFKNLINKINHGD